MLALVASRADAQDDPAWFRYGSFAITPTITLTNFGRDANVFNEADHPKSDISATLQPAVESSLRAGRGTVKWSGRADALFFQRYADQNTLGTTNALRAELPLNRMNLFIGDTYINARERPALDIDVRARRRENTISGGADIQLGAVTRVGITADVGRVSFDRGDTMRESVSIGFVLDRKTEHYAVALQRALTPLTSAVGTLQLQRENFSADSTRNTVTRRMGLGLAFKPSALVSGGIQVGVLDVESASNRVLGTTAPAVSADLGYTLLGATHFSLRTDRSVGYSVDDVNSYSIQTGTSLSVTHHLRDALAVTGSVARQTLAYQPTTSATGPVLLAPSTVVSTYDGAVAYHQGGSIHLGMHVDYSVRQPRGEAVVGGYRNLRVYTSITYGSKH